ncbi:heme exporter protein CcmD [Marinimicrobium sp. C6131]|uniref:heme exporter protein CcmD n=1 Tax=Marinimicrobium sp. C6131 TaxID=3022676 RepID=UPI00223CCD70|nr:heme exporter protein CcmD [Marinimicrobium sp. C6131]UZJ45396.1 heme exporter protein CcmD [Marinimicrobium sp. C6131]
MMGFYFDSFGEFLRMGGHGPYVWVCYLITWGTLLYLLLSPGIRRKRWLRRQAALLRRTSGPADQRGAATSRS